MAKMVMIDGKPHRQRRGKMVEIPKEWLGKVTTDKTIRRRPSKLHRKLRRATKGDPGKFQFKDKRDALKGV